jgi:Ni,Fe-hydrogenase III component G
MKLESLRVTVIGEDEKEQTSYSIPLFLALDMTDSGLALFVRVTIEEHRKRFTAPSLSPL